MIKLWGRLSSINVQKVVWGLDELGLGYERVEAGGAFGVVDEPAYRAMNPNGLVPVIEIDGFVLWESNAILRHLAATYPEAGLWPADPHRRADVDRWMDWQNTAATPAMRDAFWQFYRTPPEERDPAILARSVAASARVAHILEGHLAERAYMAGEAFTLADIVVGCHVNRWLKMPIERPPCPRLEAWYGRVSRRPGAAAVVAEPLT